LQGEAGLWLEPNTNPRWIPVNATPLRRLGCKFLLQLVTQGANQVFPKQPELPVENCRLGWETESLFVVV
jgi:hypothetical protein